MVGGGPENEEKNTKTGSSVFGEDSCGQFRGDPFRWVRAVSSTKFSLSVNHSVLSAALHSQVF